MEFVLLIGLVFGIVVYRRRADGRRVDVGLMARRLFEFGFLYGLVIATAIGATGALSRLVQVVEDGRQSEPEGLAFWLSLVIVAGSALVGMTIWLRRRFRTSDTEAESGGWSFYLSTMDLLSTGIVVGSAINVLGWLLDGWSFSPWSVAAVPIWLAVSIVHWRLPGTRRLLHYLVASTAALLGMAISTMVIVEHLLQWAYEGVMPDPLPFHYTGDTSWANSWDGLRGSLAPVLAFGVAWWWYWWRHARVFERSPERDGYVLVVGVLGGLATTVVAASGLLHTMFSWLLVGSSRDGSAVEHFHILSVFAALLVVGLALWAYHRREVPHAVRRQADGRDEVARLYDHLESGVGLVASTIGVAVLLGIVWNEVLPAGDDWDIDVDELVAFALTALLVGGPIWNRAWKRIKAHAGTVAEETSAVRRVYLFAVFGTTALVVLGSFLVMVYMVVFALLDGSLEAETLEGFRIPLALVCSTGGVAVYHGRVLRSGLRAVPTSSPPSPRTVTVVGPPAPALVAALEGLSGLRVVQYRRLDVSVRVDLVPESAVEEVRTGAGNMVVVVAADGSTEVIPVAD